MLNDYIIMCILLLKLTQYCKSAIYFNRKRKNSYPYEGKMPGGSAPLGMGSLPQ